MSRTTQFVGLTTAAQAFTATLETLDRYVGAHGMFGEDIELGRWRDADGNLYTEVKQADPWSSGPCIFTCLEMQWRNEDPPAPLSEKALAEMQSKLDDAAEAGMSPAAATEVLGLLDACLRASRLFEWTLDPTLRGGPEWDHDRGVYWI